MKRLLFSVVLVALMSSMVQAQTETAGWKFDRLTVSAGDDPVSSGITGSVWMKNSNSVFNAAVQHEQGWLLYGKEIKVGKVTGVLAGFVGHFQGAPQGGVYITVSAMLGTVAGQEISVGTLQWPGAFLWEPKGAKADGIPNSERLNSAFLSNYSLSIGPVGLEYSWLNYLNEPWNRIPAFSYTHKLRKDMEVRASMGYNTNAKTWLPYIGVTHSW